MGENGEPASIGLSNLFVGVGVSTYEVRSALPHAAEDVVEVGKLLGFPECPPLIDPDETAVVDLRALEGKLPKGGVLVFYWSGHGELGAGLRLITRDDDKPGYHGQAFEELVAHLMLTGANQLLFIVDVCHAGKAVDALRLAHHLLDLSPPSGRAWVGILTSCLDVEQARDGTFGTALRKVLESGPEDVVLRESTWPSVSRLISLETLANTLAAEWSDAEQTVDFARVGAAYPVLRNPLHAAGQRWLPQVVEHLLLAARGAGVDEVSAFTGRQNEVDRVVTWVGAREPGLHVVTGPPGTGKSAVVGRVVSWSSPEERSRLVAEGTPREHQDPGERSVAANVYARAVTTEPLAAMIDEQLVRAGLLTPTRTPRTAGRLGADVAALTDPPVIVVDGLDEAGAAAFDIARNLLAPIAKDSCVIVATREARSAQDESLLELLDPERRRLDLGTPEAIHSGLEAQHAYVIRRLMGISTDMAPRKVADLVMERNAESAEAPFLLARLSCDRLRKHPVDTDAEGWEQRVADSLAQALEADLHGFGRPELARQVLTALTWAAGPGLPIAEWCTVASAIGHEEVTEVDVSTVLGTLGRYVVQDAEEGEAVYRMAHASLAETLRPYSISVDSPFDPAALPVALALIERYRVLLKGGVPPDQPSHLWRYLSWYAAVAGPDGLVALQDLADAHEGLRAVVADAEQTIAQGYEYAGAIEDAISHLMQALDAHRALAKDEPHFRAAVAYDLISLGTLHGRLERHAAAVLYLTEGVALYETAAAENPLYQPALADALIRLRNAHGWLGQYDDALAASRRAIALYDELDRSQPYYRSWLASTLDEAGTLALSQRKSAEALFLLERAQEAYRALTSENPIYFADLAATQSHLADCHRMAGHHADAVAALRSASSALDKAPAEDRRVAELRSTVEAQLAWWNTSVQEASNARPSAH